MTSSSLRNHSIFGSPFLLRPGLLWLVACWLGLSSTWSSVEAFTTLPLHPTFLSSSPISLTSTSSSPRSRGAFEIASSQGLRGMPSLFFLHTVRPTSMLITKAATTTVEAPSKTGTDRSTTRRKYDTDNFDNGEWDNDDDDDENNDDLEYFMDPNESRLWDDPFHILLLGSTFEKPKVTVRYVSGSLEYVLDMPRTEAIELSQFAHDQGLACLGTWTRDECLTLGRQLRRRDIVCRVVPFCIGGQRGWQAKDAGAAAGGSAGADRVGQSV